MSKEEHTSLSDRREFAKQSKESRNILLKDMCNRAEPERCYTFREIEAYTGIPIVTISEEEQRILKKLRTKLEKFDII